ncbi:c-type cytochrome [Thioflexithrix psekupsensis]|uniref:Cytochrome C n=1 Tax=Thioflexithrix psekupsensis TaxID=1570016 RepID=A0A251X8X7_9GAMM|nr:cytochrome c [Thioflexithrix psekupsensis]OUD14456.1 hypothetical protein TPSD3_09125 [Thioflexithrix psekupsensis]
MNRVANTLISGLLLTTALSGTAWADDAKKDAVEYRQSVYQVIKGNFAPMAQVVKGEASYDADSFTLRAERVAALSKMALEGFIPETDMLSMDVKTGAKPNIWEEWDDFKAKNAALATESEKLLEVAKTGDLDKIKAQFAETGKTCKSCHDKFREK